MFPLIQELLSSDGGGLFDLLLPLMMCCMAMSLLRQPTPSREKQQIETDEWFTPQEIKEAFDSINKEAESWKQTAKKQKPSRFSLRRKEKERFVIEQSISPRLIRVADPREGAITFELTEAEEGGTSIKATYSPMARERIQTLRAQLPVKAPPAPKQNICKSCGRPLQPDFTVCPYCGEKLG